MEYLKWMFWFAILITILSSVFILYIKSYNPRCPCGSKEIDVKYNLCTDGIDENGKYVGNNYSLAVCKICNSYLKKENISRWHAINKEKWENLSAKLGAFNRRIESNSLDAKMLEKRIKNLNLSLPDEVVKLLLEKTEKKS